MNRSRRVPSFAAWVAVLLCAALPSLAEAPLVALRAESVDAVLKDIAALSAAFGEPLTREQVLAGLAESFGVPDPSIVDTGRPAAWALPADGLALGGAGFVLVLPVKDPVVVLATFRSQLGAETRDRELSVFQGPLVELPDGSSARPTIFVRTGDRLLVLGRVPDLVRSVDVDAALSGEGLPPGSIGLSLQLEPVAPLVRSVLLTVRTKMDEAAAAPQAEDGDGTAVLGPFSAREMRPLLDLYLRVLGDAVSNASAFQASIAVGEKDLLIRHRLTARPGTTLAAFLAAQRDTGMPAIARMLPAEAAVVFAGSLTWTDPARTWATEIATAYRTAAIALTHALGERDESMAAEFAALEEYWNAINVAEAISCGRGDLASALEFEETGFRTLTVVGLESREPCRTLLERTLASFQGRSPRLTVSREPLEPGGHPTYVTHMARPVAPGAAGQAENASASAVRATRASVVGDLLISGTDPWASEVMRDALGRPEGIGAGGGPILSDLEPFTAGPGIFGWMKAGHLLRGVAAREGAEGQLPEAALAELDGPSGTVRFVLGADGSAGTAAVAIPLALFAAIDRAFPDEEQVEPDDEPEPEAQDARTGPKPELVVGEIEAPRLVTKVDPVYPEGARRDHVQGKVILQAVIDEKGRVHDVTPLKSPDDRLTAAARKAVRQWVYEPARREGEPVAVYFTVVVNFTLD